MALVQNFQKIIQAVSSEVNYDLSLICVTGKMFLKGTVMQIKKALVNDRLLVSKVSWNFRIPAIYSFALIYPWHLLISEKVAYFLTVSIFFSVYKQNLMFVSLKTIYVVIITPDTVTWRFISCKPPVCNFVKKEIPTQLFSCEFCPHLSPLSSFKKN